MRSLEHFRRFYEYNHGYTELSTLPQICDIEVTSACNLDCRFCGRKEMIKNRGDGYMTLERFKFLVDNYGGLMVHPRLYLHGEPALHPDLAQMFLYLSKKGECRTLGTVSNGTLMTRQLFQRLMDAGMNYLVLSFEGTDKETYEFLRRGANFEATEKNIRDICEVNFSHGNRVFVRIDIIDTKQTHNGLQGFVERWRNQRGVNEVNVFQLGDWNKTVNVDALKVGESLKKEISKICYWIWFSINIQWDGGVIPCCTWGLEPFGNIFEENLTAIWNGEKFVAFRKQMLKGKDKIEWCRNCQLPIDELYAHSGFYPFSYSFLKQLRVWIQPRVT